MGQTCSLAAPAPYCAKYPEEREQQPRKVGGQGITAKQGRLAGSSDQLGDTKVSSP